MRRQDYQKEGPFVRMGDNISPEAEIRELFPQITQIPQIFQKAFSLANTLIQTQDKTEAPGFEIMNLCCFEF